MAGSADNACHRHQGWRCPTLQRSRGRRDQSQVASSFSASLPVFFLFSPMPSAPSLKDSGCRCRTRQVCACPRDKVPEALQSPSRTRRGERPMGSATASPGPTECGDPRSSHPAVSRQAVPFAVPGSCVLGTPGRGSHLPRGGHSMTGPGFAASPDPLAPTQP